MKLPESRRSNTLELKMTPLIDVVFLLLIFFVWTSSFEIPEFDLPSSIAETPIGRTEISGALPPPVESFDEILVRLGQADARQTIEFNGKAVMSLGQLQDQLAEIINLGVQPPVIIDPSPEVTMDFAVAAYDAARSAGADRVMFAAQPE